MSTTLSKDDFICAFTINKFRESNEVCYGIHYNHYVESVKHFNPFESEKPELSKRKQAMFLANVMHETEGLKFLEEKGGNELRENYAKLFFDQNIKFRKDVGYHGRGPLQLSYPANYHDASKAIYAKESGHQCPSDTKSVCDLELINNPHKVFEDKQIGWHAAVWFWKNRVRGDSTYGRDVQNGKFGASINAINGEIECVGQKNDAVTNRNTYYLAIYNAWKLKDTLGAPNCDGCKRQGSEG